MIWQAINNLRKPFLDFAYPNRCAVCNKAAGQSGIPALCDGCMQNLEKNYTNFDNVYSMFIYKGIVKNMLHKFKYSKKPFLAKTFSALAYGFIDRHIKKDNFDCITAVPIHRQRLFNREFNQSYLIAKEISQYFRKPIINGAIIRVKATGFQAPLNRSERLKNLKGAFRIKNSAAFSGKNILLIDDIFTTGATINEASRALKNGGAKSVIALTMARGFAGNS